MTAFALSPLSAISDRRLGDADRRVLLSLFSFRSNAHDFVVWPSRQRIGERAGIQAVDRISRILTKLERLGWIERRQRRGSNIYRLTDRPAALADTLTDSADTLTTAGQTDQTQLTRSVIPPSPLAMATSATTPQEATTAAAAAAARQQQEEREAQRQAQRQAQRDQERQERQERHQRRQERREQRKEQRNAERDQRSEAAQEGVQRVLSVFQTVCNVQYPNSGAIAQKVASAIERHGEQVLIRVIKHRGQSFRFPLALLRDDMIESINAELQRPAPEPGHQEERQQERRIYGVPLSVIEREARPGESLEDAGLRIYEQRRNSTLRA